MGFLQSPWSRFPSARDFEGTGKRTRWHRWWLAGSLAVVGLVAVGVVLVPRWLRARSLRQAQSYLDENDYHRAQLVLEQAVQVNPRDFAARRMLVNFYARVSLPRALAGWRELLALEPGNEANHLGLAGVALRLGEKATAREALAGVGATGQAGAPYHRLAAALALAEGDQPNLARELAALGRLEPDNLRMQFNAAAAEVFSSDPVRVAAARARLEALARGGPLRLRATLQLLQFVPAGPGESGYAALAQRLLPGPAAPAPGDFTALLNQLKALPQPEPADAAEFVQWLCANGRAREALDWVATLEAATQGAEPVLAARVQAAASLRDWTALRGVLQAGAWGPMAGGVLDLAFRARAQRELLTVTPALATWDKAVKLAAQSPEGLHGLEKLAALWAWPEARDQALWQTTRSFPGEPEAWRELALAAESADDSARLSVVLKAWAMAWPGDRSVQSSRVFLGVVRGEPDPALAREARAALTRSDALPEEIAAGAWVLAGEGRAAEGLAALDQVAGKMTGRPRAALIYCVLLSEAGRTAESGRFLAMASSAALLPEERALLARVKTRMIRLP